MNGTISHPSLLLLPPFGSPVLSFFSFLTELA